MMKTLEAGKIYDWESLAFAGWIGPGVYDAAGNRNPGMDAYNVSDYFEPDGRYKGPDMHGVEPVFTDHNP